MKMHLYTSPVGANHYLTGKCGEYFSQDYWFMVSCHTSSILIIFEKKWWENCICEKNLIKCIFFITNWRGDMILAVFIMLYHILKENSASISFTSITLWWFQYFFSTDDLKIFLTTIKNGKVYQLGPRKPNVDYDENAFAGTRSYIFVYWKQQQQQQQKQQQI